MPDRPPGTYATIVLAELGQVSDRASENDVRH
jgi:hypothetical protein